MEVIHHGTYYELKLEDEHITDDDIDIIRSFHFSKFLESEIYIAKTNTSYQLTQFFRKFMTPSQQAKISKYVHEKADAVLSNYTTDNIFTDSSDEEPPCLCGMNY